MLRIRIGRITVILVRMLRAQEASKYEARKPRSRVVLLCFCLSSFPSLLLSFSFLPSSSSSISCVLHVFFLYVFLFSFCISFFLSFFLSFLLRPGARFFLLIPSREARNTVLCYKIKDFVGFCLSSFVFLLILICFFVRPYLLFF